MIKQIPDTDNKDAPLWELDNKTHINVHYKQCKTELGKMLAPFSEYPFMHSYYGPFKTMEGFWHWLRGGGVDDKFRSLNGHRSRARMVQTAKAGDYKKVNIPDIHRVMLLSHYQKIAQHPEIQQALVESTLPFDQYYVHGPLKIIIRPDDTDRLVATFTELRKMFQEGIVPEDYEYPKLPIKK